MLMKSIDYKVGEIPDIQAIVEVYNNSGLIWPTDDFERIAKMYENSNLIVSAYDKDKLIGVARALKKYIPDGTKAKKGVKCPKCEADELFYQEGCLTCHSCGYSQCG